MGKYFIGDEAIRIDFDDGQWVEIKEELTQEDSDYISNQMMHGAARASGEDDKEIKVDMNFGRLALLERSIVNWSFTDDAGNKIPITPPNISNLRVKYRIKLLEEIDRLNSEAKAFAKN